MSNNVLRETTVAETLIVTDSLTLPSDEELPAARLKHHYNTPAYLNGAAAAKTILAYRVAGAGTITDFWAGCVTVPTGSATVDVDLKKNNVTVLSATIELNSSSVTRVATEGTLSTTAIAAGDLLEVVLTVTTPGSDVTASDVFASIGTDEAYPT